MISSILRFFRNLRQPKLTEEFTINDEEIVRLIFEEGTLCDTERVRWDELKRALIVTTDEGPFFEDVFFVLESETGGGVIVTHERALELSLLERLNKLPGFSNEAVVAAMGCTDNNSFLLWEPSFATSSEVSTQ